ncbi:hypothetical protein FQA39_LY18647 [Lamprigera yunnana]|nr:hypothetical protein FQA39_LY18647 [Lamprigera yunnana]
MHRQTLNIDKCSVNGIEVSESSEIPEKHVSVYPYFVRDSIPRLLDEELHSVIKKYDELCYYVGPERELYASYTMLSFYHHMVPPEKFTQENFKSASLLAWCLEMILTGFILDDDVMDEHGYRWMRPAYYTLPGVNTKVVLESKKLYLSAFHVLKKHFKNHMYYRQMLELLCRYIYETSFGQTIAFENPCQFKRTRNLHLFCETTYRNLVRYKSAIPQYIIPAYCAMYFVEINDFELRESFYEVFSKFGHFRTAQDDMWDIYGDYKVFGKTCTDIWGAKCTWPIIAAIKHANKEQLILLKENYGIKDEKCENVVKSVFRELDLIQKFLSFKQNLLAEVERDIKCIPHEGIRKCCYEHIERFISIEEKISYD